MAERLSFLFLFDLQMTARGREEIRLVSLGRRGKVFITGGHSRVRERRLCVLYSVTRLSLC